MMDRHKGRAAPGDTGNGSSGLELFDSCSKSEDTPPASKNPERRKRVTARVIEPDGVRIIRPVGRDAQTLEALICAGRGGITARDVGGWAVRLSHYVFKLRRTYGLQINMIEEEHGGEFPGKHGRYFLQDRVEIISTPDREAA
jgi:hypothetical protein